MKVKNILNTVIVASVFILGANSYSEETTVEKAQVVGNKALDATKRTYRSAKDKGCEMIHGKLECLGKKTAHKIDNASDRANSKSKEIKNKID
jgi:hypothetical protein